MMYTIYCFAGYFDARCVVRMQVRSLQTSECAPVAAAITLIVTRCLFSLRQRALLIFFAIRADTMPAAFAMLRRQNTRARCRLLMRCHVDAVAAARAAFLLCHATLSCCRLR